MKSLGLALIMLAAAPAESREDARRKMRKTALYILLILALPGLLIGQEEGGQGSAPAVIPAVVKQRLARLLPGPSEVEASRSGEQKFFSSDLLRS
jgi:hypothetical protein